MENNLHIFKSTEALNKSVANYIVKASQKAISERGVFSISLSGGQTPQELYALLASDEFKNQIDWTKTHVFWGDERYVPLNDERNNAHEAKLILLNKINIPSENIHIIQVDLSPAEAAQEYDKEIADFFSRDTERFDLTLLGLGDNGHTASLFPHTDILHEKSQTVKAVYLKDEQLFRISMTAPLINNSRAIIFLVSGKEKAGIVKTILQGNYLPEQYPAQLINSQNSQLLWFLDETAASLINNKP